MLVTKTALCDSSVLVIKCLDEVDYQLIFYERKQLPFSGSRCGKNPRNFFHFPVEFCSFIAKIHIEFLPEVLFD